VKRKYDPYYKQAKKEGYRSRAAYKLMEISERFYIIEEDDNVVDLGAAPGGWLQVAREFTTGRVVGIDISPIEPIEGVLTLRADLRESSTVSKVQELMGEVDVVLCDAAPNLSGAWSYDHARSIELAESALMFACETLSIGGNFVCKVFQGDMLDEFIKKAREHFRIVRVFTPKASRKESAEVYVVGKDYFRSPINVGDMFTVEILGMGKEGDGIAKVEDFVVFVPDTSPGDRVRIKIKKVAPSYAKGEITKKRNM